MKHFGSTSGLTALVEDQATPANGMVAYVTSSYNSGIQVGDIKGAFLADTDTASLVGSGELVTNGTFDTDTSGWSGTTSTGTGSISWNSGAMQLNCDGVDNRARGSQEFSTVIGATYVLQYDATLNHHARVGTTPNGSQNLNLLNQTSGSKTATFVATATTSVVTFEGFNAAGSEPNIDNISVKLADADRSVNNNGLIVNGTVTRSTVATGAELVAYSGFSASNYLEQPYNPDLDFGTGDFCVMGWVKNSDTYCGLVDRGTGAVGFGGSFAVGGNATSKLFARVGASTGYSSADVWSNTWRFVALVRKSGVAYFFVDGAASGSFVAADSVTNASAITRIGLRADGYANLDTGSLALIRISGTAPTAEQIAKIYEDELPLFQEKAACTLAGSGDAVTALAHDPTTGVLRAAQSDKTSLFLGLERVGEEDGKATCIASSNGIVAGI